MTEHQSDRLHALRTALEDRARDWLERALSEPDTLELSFAAAGRACGPAHATGVRVALLAAHGPDGERLGRLYQHGTAAERLAVLRALPELPLGTDGLPLVHDALRTNDPRLVAEALGRYGARYLTPHDWRQAVLKCLFTGIPLTEVYGLARRCAGDAELARMLRDFADERTAAGRPVPDDLHHALELTTATRDPAVPGEHQPPSQRSPFNQQSPFSQEA